MPVEKTHRQIEIEPKANIPPKAEEPSQTQPESQTTQPEASTPQEAEKPGQPDQPQPLSQPIQPDQTQLLSQPIQPIQPIQLKASTLKTYRTVYDRSLRQAVEKRQINPDEPIEISPMDLVDDWILGIGTCRPRTSNTHRSALLWALAHNKAQGWEVAHERLASMRQESVRGFDAFEGNELGKRSRTPGRMIPEAALHTLLNTLATRGEWGARSQYFLIAGIASGARPVEWPDAEWVDQEKTVLRIFTAKVKARNAWNKIPPLTFTTEIDLDDEINMLCGLSSTSRNEVNASAEDADFERRMSTLDLTAKEAQELRGAKYRNGIMLFRDVFIEPQHRTYVRLHIDSVQLVIESERKLAQPTPGEDITTEIIFRDGYFNPARHCIWRACKKAFPNGDLYSLVDTRSTFSANRKAQFGLEGASRDLGHQGVTTSRDHYAPASKAWSRYKPFIKP